MITAHKLQAPNVPVGKIKSFGAFGPKYEVGTAVRPVDNGDWVITIKLVESGEDAEYRYLHMMEDPEVQ